MEVAGFQRQPLVREALDDQLLLRRVRHEDRVERHHLQPNRSGLLVGMIHFPLCRSVCAPVVDARPTAAAAVNNAVSMRKSLRFMIRPARAYEARFTAFAARGNRRRRKRGLTDNAGRLRE